MSLLSHARRAIGDGIETSFTQRYRYNDTQAGFQRVAGAETAITRNTGNRMDMKYIAEPDLKSACNLSPQDKLMRAMVNKALTSLAKVTVLTLSLMKLQGRDDGTKTMSECPKSENKGGPLSPPLYNVYMDTLATEM